MSKVTFKHNRRDGGYYVYTYPIPGSPRTIRLDIRRAYENLPGMNWVVIDSDEPDDFNQLFDTLDDARTYIGERYPGAPRR
jgi:hypothetical protein